MPEDYGDKTEQPTDRRRQESRRKGNVAKSVELSSSVLLLGGMLAIYVVGSGIFEGLDSLMRRYLGPEETWVRADVQTIRSKLIGEVSVIGEAMLPLLGFMAVLALAIGVLQVGFIVTLHPLAPSLSKISPLKGLGRIFSKRGLMKLLVSLAKVAAIGAVAALTIAEEMATLVNLPDLGFTSIVRYAGGAVFGLAVKLGLVLIVLGIIDYAYQKWQHEQEMKMTKQELRQEMKDMEGDPHIRSHRRQMARRIAFARMSQQVPEADVVVTNPTELAVALKYDADEHEAPVVVAKGAGFMALRIRQIAVANGVPIVEKKPLARALYRDVEVGQEVPPHLYRAVAELLAYVYQLQRRTFRPRQAV